MRIQAQGNDTVNDLLFRELGTDDDQTEEAFYLLNPTINTPFLEPLQWVNLPEKQTPPETADDKHVIEVWE